jgi:hypothetical protein
LAKSLLHPEICSFIQKYLILRLWDKDFVIFVFLQNQHIDLLEKGLIHPIIQKSLARKQNPFGFVLHTRTTINTKEL